MKILAVDTETTWDALNKLRVISICEQGGTPYIAYRYDQHGEEIPADVVKLLNSSKCIFHNAWFDVGVLAAHGIRPRKVCCTMLAEMFIATSSQAISLKDLVWKYERFSMSKELQKSDWSQPLTEQQIEYSLRDVEFLHNIYDKQVSYLKRSGAITHLELKQEVVRVWAPDLYYGYPVDREALNKIADQCKAQYQEHLEWLLTKVPIEMFLVKNATVKAYKEALGTFCAGIHEVVGNKTTTLKNGTVKQGLDDFKQTQEFRDALKMYILSGGKDIVIETSSASFAKNMALHFGLDETQSYNEKSLKHMLEVGTLPPKAAEVFEAVLKARSLTKIISTYATLKDDKTYIDNDGLCRLKLGFSYTVSGRIGLTPLSVMPKPDEDEGNLANKLREAYLPPKGHKVLSFDYKSAEDIVAGVLYNDKMKIKICEDGYDQYLMFASKLFGNFDYNDPKQTKELKSKYKDFRQAVKAILLARNYGAGATKLEMMANEALKKAGINKEITGQYILEKYAELFEGVSTAQEKMNNITVNNLNGIYDGYNFDPTTLRTLRQRDNNPFGVPAKTRAEVLMDAGQVMNVSSTLGLCRTFVPHRDFKTTSYGSKSTRVTDIVNFPIQASATEATWLAIIMIKHRFPHIQIGVSIHDSVVCFVPETDDLEHTKTEIQKLMSLAGWVAFQYKLGTDGDILDRGW